MKRECEIVVGTVGCLQFRFGDVGTRSTDRIFLPCRWKSANILNRQERDRLKQVEKWFLCSCSSLLFLSLIRQLAFDGVQYRCDGKLAIFYAFALFKFVGNMNEKNKKLVSHQLPRKSDFDSSVFSLWNAFQFVSVLSLSVWMRWMCTRKVIAKVFTTFWFLGESCLIYVLLSFMVAREQSIESSHKKLFSIFECWRHNVCRLSTVWWCGGNHRNCVVEYQRKEEKIEWKRWPTAFSIKWFELWIVKLIYCIMTTSAAQRDRT